MPELGTIDNKQAASLAGVAPVDRQSGQWKGKSFIQGGRAWLRQALYMPAL
ncbi:transposase, partial [Pseudaminobacter sp. NGMCC 1.201702]|uniref:transposase n=1 Tax=Pseudaminobacter sp. NGMCC 1.201702 TaxID=3391825 RepID=UPI0039EEBD97